MQRVPGLTSVVAHAALSLPLSVFTSPAVPQTSKCRAATPNFYSLDKEKALGSQLAQEVNRSSVPVHDSIVIDYLNRLGKQIAKTSGAKFPIVIRVLDSNVMDADTLPGGFQYVSSSLILATESKAELAGVLAHGIARTSLRSSTALATKAELTQLVSIPAMILHLGGIRLIPRIDRLMPPRDRAIVSSSEFEAVKERLKAWQAQKSIAPNKLTLRTRREVPDLGNPFAA